MNNEQYLEMDILPVSMATSNMMNDLANCPIYEFANTRTIKENAGVVTGKSPFTFYDISNTSPEFKASHMMMSLKGIQTILSVNGEIIKQASVEMLGEKGSYVELLKLNDAYNNLSIEEKNSLGHNYVSLVNRENGLEIKPVLVQRQAEGDIYLQVHSGAINPDILAKIGSEITTLNSNEFGLYEQVAKEIDSKSL